MAQLQNPSRRRRALVAGVNLLAKLARPLFRSAREHHFTGANDVRSILVLELWNIGDLILLMPFLAQLRTKFPNARITLLARAVAEDLLRGTGLADEIIAADLTWSPEESPYDRTAKKTNELWKTWRMLRGRNFDVAFSARQHIREHIVLAMAKARRRVGLGFASANAILTDVIVVDDPNRHKVDDWMRLLEPFGGAVTMSLPRLHVTERERSWAEGFLAGHGIAAGDLLVGIHPGGSLPEKRWPLERFREVASVIAARPEIRILSFIEPSGYGAALGGLPHLTSVKVSLREMTALIEQCDLLLCNDSGPMHIAAALGVRTVAVFGSGIESWFGPLGPGHVIVRGEGASKVMGKQGIWAPTGITTAQVLEAITKVVHELETADIGARSDSARQ